MRDDVSCSSTSSLPDLEPLEVPLAELKTVLPEPHVFRLGNDSQPPEYDPASIWDEPVQQESHWEEEVRQETRRLMAQVCSETFCEEELGYPKWPEEEMKDPTYFRAELQEIRNDPRKNPNHGRSLEDQEFWNEAARQPWAKVLLRKEQFWTERRNVWLKQYGAVIRGNRGRSQVVDQLEDCPMELKRLVAPFLHHRVVENLLLTALEEASELGLPLGDFLPGSELMRELQACCARLAEPNQAVLMQNELDGRMRAAQEAALKEQEQQAKAQPRTIIDMEGLRVALEYGQKCRKDGLVEYHRGNFEEALHSWRQGDVALRRFRAPLRCEVENAMVRDLHGSVLRNLSQAALRLGEYTEALDTANRAIALTGGRGLPDAWDALGLGLEAAGDIDVKAWFRRHMALEGLGEVQEAAACLLYIEEAAVSRPDGDRLRQDCQRRRDHLRKRQTRSAQEEARMLRLSLKSGVFGDREAQAAAPSVPEARIPAPAESARPSSPRGQRSLTREGAWEVLEDLLAAYGDSSFVQRVDKLSKDVRFDAREFAPRLARLSFEAQEPILRKWGFEASVLGAKDLKLAVQESILLEMLDFRSIRTRSAVPFMAVRICSCMSV
ncbi:unnamed protein product [Effrenium voratum]|nr:unnamed protein product [Effrenium voratum]